MFDCAITKSGRVHHARWFLIGGCIGLAIAIFCATNLGQHVLPEKAWLLLWPMGISLMALDNATLGTEIFALLIVYGSNFILYGLVTLLFSLAARFFHFFSNSDNHK
jgi:hypothetical protein